MRWLLLLALVACAPVTHDKGGEDPKPLPPIEEIDKVELLLFSAPWCKPCHEMHPEIERQLDVDIPVTLYVGTDWNSTKPPTEASVADYKKQMPLDFNFVPDPWKWTTYKKYLGTNVSIPAAAVLVNGEMVKKFPAGTFTAKQVTDYVEALIKE